MGSKQRVSINANRVRITESCRRLTGDITGDMDAFDRAVEILRRTYADLARSPVHDVGKGSEFILTLVVEYDR